MKIRFWKNKIPLSVEEKKARNRDRFLLVCSGLLLALSFPPMPFPFTMIIFIALIPYLMVIEKREKLIEINHATYLMGFVFSLFSLYWVGSWQKEADPFLMISGILLIFVNPVFFLIPSTLYYYSRFALSRKVSVYLLPFFFAAYEFAYMLTDLSFPWLSLGNGLSLFTTFIQIADVIGQLGLTLIIVFVNILLYKSLIFFKSNRKNFILNAATVLLIFLFIIIYGIQKRSRTFSSESKVKVGIIQPNLNPWEKWKQADLNELTNSYLDLSRKAINEGARIIFWPETALPVYLRTDTYSDVFKKIKNFVDSSEVYLFTGMPDVKFYFDTNHIPPDAKYNKLQDYYYATYNSILLFDPRNSIIQSYGKMKLVPFGERVPFVDAFPFLGKLIKWGVGISGWNVGKDTTIFTLKTGTLVNSKLDTIKIGGLVCYESIYPILTSEFVKRGADFLAVVTNDSWYGNLSGPYQHKEFAALRAVENRRSILRAANGGISCIINPLGETVIQSKMFVKKYIVKNVIINNEKTFFTKNPLLVPIFSSVFSIWIFTIYFIKKIKTYFRF